jgi:2-(1,2-epoxy-1,2-dihydrophenyl)acetyl-CoA isomerase
MTYKAIEVIAKDSFAFLYLKCPQAKNALVDVLRVENANMIGRLRKSPSAMFDRLNLSLLQTG